MNEEVHNVLHQGVIDRLEKVEESIATINMPEDGTLARMKSNLEAADRRVESKLNWVIGVLLTSFLSAFISIVIARLVK